MKTKTTLAALLLAAVMVTPSYGARKIFLTGAKEYLRKVQDKEVIDTHAFVYFGAFVEATACCHAVNVPNGVTLNTCNVVVALYVSNHPEHHHRSHLEIVKRACKEAFPKENKNLVINE